MYLSIQPMHYVCKVHKYVHMYVHMYLHAYIFMGYRFECLYFLMRFVWSQNDRSSDILSISMRRASKCLCIHLFVGSDGRLFNVPVCLAVHWTFCFGCMWLLLVGNIKTYTLQEQLRRIEYVIRFWKLIKFWERKFLISIRIEFRNN